MQLYCSAYSWRFSLKCSETVTMLDPHLRNTHSPTVLNKMTGIYITRITVKSV